MPLQLVVWIMLVTALQTSPADRARAEELARAGRTIEAIALFERIVDANPADLEAKLWVARLQLRLGRTDDAEAGFRSVLQINPEDVDARIGLGIVLTRTGYWQEALTILRSTEAEAGQNADLFAALARAYRQSGDDQSALDYFRRAKALGPGDPDTTLGFEGVVRTYGHWVGLEGFGQGDGLGNDVGSTIVTAAIRANANLKIAAGARWQWGPGYSDTIAGGGVIWRANRTTTAALNVTGGSGNTALAELDASAEVVYYAGIFEAGASVRQMKFSGSDLTAISPILAWDREPWRLDARYTWSRSAFDASGESSVDHSIMLRSTWQGWRRIALHATYAYGIESFEHVTADRLGSLGTTTLAGGARVDLSSLTRITSTWEHQWRSNQTTIDRLTVALIQFIP